MGGGASNGKRGAKYGPEEDNRHFAHPASGFNDFEVAEQSAPVRVTAPPRAPTTPKATVGALPTTPKAARYDLADLMSPSNSSALPTSPAAALKACQEAAAAAREAAPAPPPSEAAARPKPRAKPLRVEGHVSSDHGGGELRDGADVEICGLEKAKELNGMRGRLEYFDAASGRWQVEIAGSRPRKIKAENLRAVGGGAVAHAKAAPKIPRSRRYPNVDVPWSSRKIVIQWARSARKRVNARLAAKPQGGGRRRKRKKRGRARVDRVISLYLDNQKELARLCLKDPGELLATQLELLDRRIGALDGEVQRLGIVEHQRGKTSTASQKLPENDVNAPLPPQSVTLGAVPASKLVQEIPMTWEQRFDTAMARKRGWKQSRDEVHAQAMEVSREKWLEEVLPAAEKAAAVPKANLVEQLRSERAKIAELLPIYEAKMQRRKEQETLEQGEAFHEEILAVEQTMAEVLREQRELEAEQRRRLEAQAAAERQRQEEEQRRLEEELRRKEEEIQRRRAEEERLRVEREEEERRRREEEERLRVEEEQRLRREWEAEQERLRLEAEEQERLRLEAEEALRLQREAEERERVRLAEEAERLRREAEEERRRRLEEEEARRIAFEEQQAALREEERRRLQAEEAERRRLQQEEEQRRQEAAEAERRRLEEEQEQLRLRMEEEERRRLREEEEWRRQQAEEEERRRLQEEEHLRFLQAQEEERRRLREEEEERERRRLAEEQERLRQEEEAAEQLRAQLEAQARAAEDEERRRQEKEQKQQAQRRRAWANNAFAGLEAACGSDGEEDEEAKAPAAAASADAGGGGGGGDWMSRALAALGDEDSSDESDEDGDAEGDMDESRNADRSDVDLLRLTAAIASRIEGVHGPGVGR